MPQRTSIENHGVLEAFDVFFDVNGASLAVEVAAVVE
jgi:hypothetical protein